MKTKGFTLIELLVVIAIIALLLSIIMPALNKVKSYATQVVCSNRIHQQYLGISLYASENEDRVPNPGLSGGWLWDMSFWATNEISRYAGFDDSEIFFCPANKVKKYDDARFWQFTMSPSSGAPEPLHDESTLSEAELRVNYRLLPMIYAFDRVNSHGDSILPPNLENGKKAQWVRKLSESRNPGSQFLIMDAVVSYHNDWNFFRITSGGVGARSQGSLWDNSNHQSSKMIHSGSNSGPAPSGANIGFIDGRVEWRKFEKMGHQIIRGMWFWW